MNKKQEKITSTQLLEEYRQRVLHRLSPTRVAARNLEYLFARYLQGDATLQELTLAEKAVGIFVERCRHTSLPVSVHKLEEMGREECQAILGYIHARRSTASLRLRRYVLGAAAAVLLLVGMFAGIKFYNYMSQEAVALRSRQAEVKLVSPLTAIKQTRLSDGTDIMLNRGTTITYSSLSFNHSDRRLTMPEGEAYFRVAKNAQCPFTIDLGGVEVKVVGTSFNIQNYRAVGSKVVSVLTGKVELFNSAGRMLCTLTPDHEARLYTDVAGRLRLSVNRHARCYASTLWTSGGLSLRNASAKELCLRLGRQYNMKVEASSAVLRRDMHFTADFAPDESLHNVLAGLRLLYGVKARIQGRTILLYDTTNEQ